MPSKISWTDESWNPFIGCSKISAGCQNCYAERMACRLSSMEFAKGNFDGPYSKIVGGGHPRNLDEHEHYRNRRGLGWHGNTLFIPLALKKPLHWRKPRMCFVCSMSDLFHNDNNFDDIDKVFAIIALCQSHIFQILTKRPAKMAVYFSEKNRIYKIATEAARMVENGDYHYDKIVDDFKRNESKLSNAWLGVTAENQEQADYRIPILLDIPAKVRFVSCEPLLEEIDIRQYLLSEYDKAAHDAQMIKPLSAYRRDKIDWVIAGAESGPKMRPCENAWIDSLAEQCEEYPCPLFVKQIQNMHHRAIIKDPSQYPQEMPTAFHAWKKNIEGGR